MKIERFAFRTHISLTSKMYQQLKKKRKGGYTIAGYVRIAIERALREDAIEEAG